MAQINLRDFYPSEYTADELVEVSDEVAAELRADVRYEKTHERVMRRFKVHSLDADDGTTEAAAFTCHSDNPEVIFFCMERHCELCRALNSLPEIQGRRIEAHYLLGRSIAKISEAEGTSERRVRKSINRGLKSMKIYLLNFQKQGAETTDFCPDI